LNLRPATAADIPLIRTLAHRIWRESYLGIISGEQIEFMLGWMYSAEQLASEFAACVPWELVEENGEPIGFLSYKLEDDSRVKLNKLYLLPEHQHRGHSRTLLAHVCERARALGAREVRLQVNKRNARAIAAYVKAGFQIASEAVADIGHGFVMDDFFMAKAV
jgi:ribosomal protein S18 acetylase RimI-like enzyme